MFLCVLGGTRQEELPSVTNASNKKHDNKIVFLGGLDLLSLQGLEFFLYSILSLLQFQKKFSQDMSNCLCI